MNRPVLSPAAVEYPSGDGRPMAENDWQLIAMIDAITAPEAALFAPAGRVRVGRPLHLLRGRQPARPGGADVFVVFGVPGHKRPIYKLWEEREVPSFAMEVASAGTWREDEGRKAALYERLGIREYWQYDPTGEYLGLHLKGPAPRGGRVRAPAGGGVAGRGGDPVQRDARARVAGEGRGDAISATPRRAVTFSASTRSTRSTRRRSAGRGARSPARGEARLRVASPGGSRGVPAREGGSPDPPPPLVPGSSRSRVSAGKGAGRGGRAAALSGSRARGRGGGPRGGDDAGSRRSTRSPARSRPTPREGWPCPALPPRRPQGARATA